LLVKLRYEDIQGQQPLAYDLLDSQGQVMLCAGNRIESRNLKRLVEQGVFCHHDKLSLSRVIHEELPNFEHWAALAEIRLQPESPTSPPPLSPIFKEQSASLLASMHGFWRQLEGGAPMDLALLEVIGEKLVGEIVSKIGQLQYISQLRIRDQITYSHTLDVTAVSVAIGVRLGLPKKDLELLALGALLHDLGKIFIPKAIMFKPTRLTDKEFQVMKSHPEIGYRIIKDQLGLPEEVARPALEHQEMHTGGGYPQNLQGDEIHFFSQIVKIADVYDALTSKRSYKEAIPSEQAIKIMLLEGSKSFNPEIFIPFLSLANFPTDKISTYQATGSLTR